MSHKRIACYYVLQHAAPVEHANLEQLAIKAELMGITKEFLEFEETGHLEPGVHPCTWNKLLQLTFTNSHRSILGGKLLDFLRWPYHMGVFPRVYIGGGFISNRPFPQDVDVILETQFRFGPEAFGAIEPFFVEGLDKILELHSVHLHFWMEGAPPTLMDFRSFFQYQRSAGVNPIDTKKRGIVCLSLLPADITSQFQSGHAVECQGSFRRITSHEQFRSMAA